MIEFKRGATFEAIVTFDPVSLPSGVVSSLTGWTGTSEARRRGGALVSALTFAWIDAAARIARVTASSTAAWPIGFIDVDMVIVSPDLVRVATPTLSLRVIQGPTHV